MALVQSVRRPATIAGFPLSAWAFALRIWAAMMGGNTRRIVVLHGATGCSMVQRCDSESSASRFARDV
jgi:hypothetical protein